MSARDFIAIDVETANASYSSICSVGLVHFRAGEVFKSLNILVDPEDEFSGMNIAIHGIRPEDVVGKPTMKDVIPLLGEHFAGSIIVHHSPFDRAAIRKAAAKYGIGELPCHWIDTLSVARRAWESFRDNGGYGLKNLARIFSIEFEHHVASEDARAAGLILLRAMKDTGLGLEDWIAQRAGAENRKHTRIAREATCGGPLTGQTIVFTGALRLSRNEAAELAAQSGAAVEDRITRKTTVLVVGDQDPRIMKGNAKSAKQKRAEELMSTGTSIRIVFESDFLLMLN